MKYQPPTLIDRLYRGSFANEPVYGWRNNSAMREKLRTARRFILGNDMASMLADLATAAFLRKDGSIGDMSASSLRNRNAKIEQMRTSARAPFPTTWIEYPLRTTMIRSHELLNKPYAPGESPGIEGWLIEQHPGIESAFMLSVFSGNDHGEAPDLEGFHTWTFPISYVWVADDTSVIPWRSGFTLPDGSASSSEVATGLPGYVTDRIGFAQHPLIETMPMSPVLVNLVREWVGVMRRALALLATLSDLPLAFREVKAARGFIGKGSYKRYLDHQTITLTIPMSEHKKIARQAIAAARRRAHGVRSHWRLDWRHPLDPLCEHEFDAHDAKHLICKLCHGIKTHIPAHQRGDAALGLVTHDYIVKAG